MERERERWRVRGEGGHKREMESQKRRELPGVKDKGGVAEIHMQASTWGHAETIGERSDGML